MASEIESTNVQKNVEISLKIPQELFYKLEKLANHEDYSLDEYSVKILMNHVELAESDPLDYLSYLDKEVLRDIIFL